MKPIDFKKQSLIAEKIQNTEIMKSEREIITNLNFAPELLPVLKNPKDVQELRKIDKADRQDMQEWIETAFEVLPEISCQIRQAINDPIEETFIMGRNRMNHSFT